MYVGVDVGEWSGVVVEVVERSGERECVSEQNLKVEEKREEGEEQIILATLYKSWCRWMWM